MISTLKSFSMKTVEVIVKISKGGDLILLSSCLGLRCFLVYFMGLLGRADSGFIRNNIKAIYEMTSYIAEGLCNGSNEG